MSGPQHGDIRLLPDRLAADAACVAEEIYRENAIGTAAECSYADGKIVRGESILGTLDVGIGMLSAAKFALLVSHDDDEREFASTSGGEASPAKALELGWTVISMKNDWRIVFPASVSGCGPVCAAPRAPYRGL